MYKQVVLLQNLLDDTTQLEPLVQRVTQRVGLLFDEQQRGIMRGPQGQEIPIVAQRYRSGEYPFSLYYHPGMGPFADEPVQGLNLQDYQALITVIGHNDDYDMDYFNDFLLLCEAAQAELGGVIAFKDPDTGCWCAG